MYVKTPGLELRPEHRALESRVQHASRQEPGFAVIVVLS